MTASKGVAVNDTMSRRVLLTMSSNQEQSDARITTRADLVVSAPLTVQPSPWQVARSAPSKWLKTPSNESVTASATATTA